MKPSAELFELVKSLSKSEKGYFRKYCSIYGQVDNSNYIRLFEAIDALKEYDEKKLLKKLNDDTLAGQLHVYKNYLQRMILRCLNRYYEDKYIGSQVMELLQHVEILFDKALYSQCSKIVAKAKKMATRYEKFYLLTEIHAWEIRLAMRHPNSPKQEEEVLQLFGEKEKARGNMKNSDDYLSDHHRIFAIQRKWSGEKEAIADDIQSCRNILIPERYSSVKQTTGFLSEFTFYISIMRYYMIRDRYDIAYRYQKELLNLFIVAPHMIEDNVAAFYNVVFNNQFATHFLDEHGDEAETTLMAYRRQLRELPRIINSTHYQVLIFLVDVEYNAMRVGEKKDWSRLTEVAEHFETGLTRFGTRLAKERTTVQVLTLASNFFIAGRYKEALHWLNKIVHVNAPQYLSVKATVRILYLLVHYELKNEELLHYLIKSTQRALEQQKLLTEVERLVLMHLKKLIVCVDPGAERLLLHTLRDELYKLTQDEEKHRQLDNFDYLEWLDAKLKK